ncbi:MAG: hypothetical protein GC149_11375 [Gammaproteobacteria bacterium]|nr:hypothetical protein [Gammaproteobacteria bacterium]
MEKGPLEIVLAFIAEMNDWEHKMYLVSRVKEGRIINHESDKAILPKESYSEFMKKYYDVFNKYCTKRERKYGGHPNSWTRHGQYQGASKETVQSVNEVNPNRAEVIIKGGQFPESKFMFVVFKKGGEWRIDSAKTGNEGEWDDHYL